MLGSCRKCEECIRARKRSYTGRILCEMEYAHSVDFFTFTYGGGYSNPDAYVLDYAHVQRLFKRWRKVNDYRFRYLVVGEFGTQKQRAHWHAMIFWDDTNKPEFQYDEDVNYDWWEHGHVRVEKPRSGQASASYIMDYLDKDQMMKTQIKFSTVPALGERYLLEYAADHARKGVPLFARGNIYTIPGNNKADGKPFYYPVEKDRAVFVKMIMTWVAEFRRNHPDKPPALSPLIEEWLDDNADDYWLHSIKHYDTYHAVRAMEDWGFTTRKLPPDQWNQSYETLDTEEDVMLHRTCYGSRLVLYGRAGYIIWRLDVGEALQKIHRERVRRNPLGDHPPMPPRDFGRFDPETGGLPDHLLLSKAHELINLTRRQIKSAVYKDWTGNGQRRPLR